MNEYDKGRLNLPFVGIPTFGKSPYVSDWDKIEAEIAIIGAFDGGTSIGQEQGLVLDRYGRHQPYFPLVMQEHMITTITRHT